MGAVVPFEEHTVGLKRQRLAEGEAWNAKAAIATLKTHKDPLEGLGLGATRVVSAFALVDDINVEDVPRYRDQSTGEESAVYLLHQNTQPDWPQAQPNYPGVAGQFMSGVPIFIGAGNPTPRSISLWLFLDDACRMIIEDYNSQGRSVPYACYAEDGSRDFPISLGSNAVVNAPAIPEKLIPAHAAYTPSLVTPGLAGSDDSIYFAGQITVNCRPNPSPDYPAHGPILATMEHRGEYYIYCDAGNEPGNLTVTTNDLPPLAVGSLPTQADGVCTGCLGLSSGSGNDPALNVVMTARLYAYNAGAPYLVMQRSWSVGAIGASEDRQLIVVTVPYPDYYRWEVAAAPIGIGGPSQMNVRAWQVTASHLYCHLMAPNIDSRFGEMEANRALGICCTVQNPTNKEHKGGLWLGYQSTLGEDWTTPLYTGPSAYQFISTVNTNLNRSAAAPLLENGAYFFPLPANNLNMQWKQPFNVISGRTGSGQTAADAGHRILTHGDLRQRVWAMINLQAPLPGVGTQAQQINYRFAMCGEYKSRNPFTTLMIPRETPEEWADGLETAMNMYQFYENPNHLETIKNVIESIGEKNPRVKKIIEVIKKWAPFVLKTGAGLASILA